MSSRKTAPLSPHANNDPTALFPNPAAGAIVAYTKAVLGIDEEGNVGPGADDSPSLRYEWIAAYSSGYGPWQCGQCPHMSVPTDGFLATLDPGVGPSEAPGLGPNKALEKVRRLAFFRVMAPHLPDGWDVPTFPIGLERPHVTRWIKWAVKVIEASINRQSAQVLLLHAYKLIRAANAAHPSAAPPCTRKDCEELEEIIQHTVHSPANQSAPGGDRGAHIEDTYGDLISKVRVAVEENTAAVLQIAAEKTKPTNGEEATELPPAQAPATNDLGAILGNAGEQISRQARAAAFMLDRAKTTGKIPKMQDIGLAIGVDRATLYRSEEFASFRDARKALKEKFDKPPKGTKNAAGDVDASDD
jgi:hypothetical protein